MNPDVIDATRRRRRGSGRLRWALPGLLAVLATSTAVSAQSMAVRVVDSGSGRPIRGAMVTLSEDPGRSVSRRLTDGVGVARFDAGHGVYRIDAQMIGYRTGLRTGIEVSSARPVELEIAVDPRPIAIPGVDVEADERCRLRAEEGRRVAGVWDEVRKALEAARWTADRGVYEYRIERRVRDIEWRTGRVLTDRRERKGGYARVPFQSLPPARLVADGYVQPDAEGGGSVYYGPDEEVLLSDEFLATHCMRVIVGRGAREGWIGLAFEPLRERRIPDIAGTLWVEPESWELRHLDYWYENLRLDVPVREVGGDVRFERLPDGTWIIPEWTIRLPLLGRGRDLGGRERLHQVGVREETGRTLRVRSRDGGLLITAGSGAIDGVVVDSTGANPVEGAIVELVGHGRTATTDASGAFLLTELEPGDYRLTFRHPSSGTAAGRRGPVMVAVEEDRVTPVHLRMPSRVETLTSLCDESGAGEGDGGIGRVVGRVVDAATGLGLPGATVRIGWAGAEDVGAVADDGGWYRVCEVPRSTSVVMTPSWGPFTGGGGSIMMPDEGRAVVHDLTVDVQGRAHLSGVVRESSTGIPVEGARVELRVEGEVVQEVTTDEHGAFAMEGAPAGEHRLGVYHASYRGGGDSVRSRPGERVGLSVELTRIPRELSRLLPELSSRVDGVSVEVISREPTTPPPPR